MTKKCHWLILLLFLVQSTMWGQMRIYDSNQLSSNLITSIAQDGDGYIWIATKYGLNAFDGVRFTQYFHHETNEASIASNHVEKLFTDRDGHLWTLTYKAIQRYNPLTDQFERVDVSGNITNYKDICQSKNNTLLVLTDQGIIEIDCKSMHAKPLIGANRMRPLKNNPKFIYLDRKQRLWAANDYQVGVYNKNKKIIHNQDLSSYGKIAGINEDRNGNLIVVTNTAILKLEEKRDKLEMLMPISGGISVRRVYRNVQGDLLVGSYGNHIRKIDLEHRQLLNAYQWADRKYPWESQNVYAFCEDRDGNAWIGCYQNGLVFLSAKNNDFHYLDLRQNTFSNGKILTTAFCDNKGKYYLGIEGNGLYNIDDQGRAFAHYLAGTTINTMYDDGQGYFWIGLRWNGLSILDKNTGKTTSLLERGQITSITSDKLGHIYTTSFDGEIRCWDSKTKHEIRSIKSASKFLNVAFVDNHGLLWIGHYGGVDVYNSKTGKRTNISTDNLLKRSVVNAITQTTDGSIWIATNNGLFEYTSKSKWLHYTTADGLPCDFICGMVEDKWHRLWLSSYHGLSRTTIKKSASKDENNSPIFINYYMGNGLGTTQYLQSVCGKSPYGQLFFADSHGLTWFSPDQIRHNDFLRGITLTAIEENGTMRPPTGDYNFAYNSSFTLYFSPLDYREMENVHYEYRFSNEPDDTWHKLAEGISELTFNQLASGGYDLLVRACDNGVYSPIKEIHLGVSSPWWRSWWAYFIYIIIVACMLVWGRMYYRRRKEIEANEEKIRFFVDISHELRSPLTLIKSPLDMLLKRSDFDQQTRRALHNMSHNTERLLTLVNQILSIRKIEKGQMKLEYTQTDMKSFVENLVHAYDLQAENRKINLSFLADSDSNFIAWIDRNWFNKVINNLLGNALKFVEEGGDVCLHIKKTNSQIIIKVSDNGPGIDEKQLKRIFDRFYQSSARQSAGQMGYGIGLNLAHKIVLLHGGTITAANRTDVEHGTEFTVSFPTGNNHLPKEQLVASQKETTHNTEFDEQTKDALQQTAVIPQEGETKIRKKTNYTIAVVDDDEDVRQFLHTELGFTYRVLTYEDGQQALEGIIENMPDLVISDVVMPIMDGMKLLYRLKHNTRTSHIPVILLTTKTELQSRISGLEEGADAYMDKPFNLEELEALATSLIDNRKRMKGKFSGMQEQANNVRQVDLKGNDEELMERIMKVVNERLTDDDFNVETLVTEIGMSRAQLHRRMKDMTGLAPSEFIRNLRMQQAAKLLEKGDISVSQVVYAIGLSNPTHFTTAFRKYFGVSPSEYMAKHSCETKSQVNETNQATPQQKN